MDQEKWVTIKFPNSYRVAPESKLPEILQKREELIERMSKKIPREQLEEMFRFEIVKGEE